MRLQNATFWRISLFFLILTSCTSPKKEGATLLIYGGPIYTVDTIQSTVEAVATKDNKILFAGSLADAEKYKDDQTQLIDLEGKTMTPGLIEGHGHFMGFGYNEL
ncbi:MAG: amidohydrolase, partial [Eudoraea sp.]